MASAASAELVNNATPEISKGATALESPEKPVPTAVTDVTILKLQDLKADATTPTRPG